MSDTTLRPNSLVLYKTRPARIIQMGRKKIEIKLEDGDTLSVRHKDVTLLHPGPLNSLANLRSQKGEIKTAWELLAGETTTLTELTELAYGEATPQTVWAAWEWVEDGLYFSGEPEEIQAHTAVAVSEIEAEREAKAAAERAWNAFLERVQTGTYDPDADGQYLQEVAALALETNERSRVMAALGEKETSHQAHDLLLRLGYWDEKIDPYPARFNLPTDAPSASLPDLPEEERRDLTHLTALAIDDEGNKDPDDAISWEDGRLWVHIADVAALVPPDSEADREARARGANLYLPEGVVPMLPPDATRTLGLGLNDTSPALSFGLDVDEEGNITNVEITPSWVKVTRLSYAEAETQLEASPLREMRQITGRFEARRQAQGAIEIDLPEVKVYLEEGGAVVIKPLLPLQSRNLVRDAMLLTGEAVAQFAREQQIPLLFTSQETYERDEEPGPGLAGQFALRRTMKRSQQSTVPGPHAGLGMTQYVQTTSPLRRYLDLVAHQQLRAFVKGEPLLEEQAVVARLGATDAVSGAVRTAERLAIKHWQMVYLLQNPEWEGEGIVVDKRGSRDIVLIPTLGIETEIYARHDFELNGRVALQFKEVNLPQLEAHFTARPPHPA